MLAFLLLPFRPPPFLLLCLTLSFVIPFLQVCRAPLSETELARLLLSNVAEDVDFVDLNMTLEAQRRRLGALREELRSTMNC